MAEDEEGEAAEETTTELEDFAPDSSHNPDENAGGDSLHQTEEKQTATRDGELLSDSEIDEDGGRRGSRKRRRKKNKKKKEEDWPGVPFEYIPCPHLHFKADVVEREALTRNQHTELLATPKGYRWEPDRELRYIRKEKPGKGGSKNGKGKRKLKRAKKRTSKDDKEYIGSFLSEIWKSLPPKMVEQLRQLLVEEFGMSEKEADDFIEEQKENALAEKKAGKKKKKKPFGAPDTKVGVRHKWVKDFSRIFSSKITDYVVMMLSCRRTQRIRKLAEAILNHFCDITGEKTTLSTPKTQVQRIMVFVADRVAVWLDSFMKDSEDKKTRDMGIEAKLSVLSSEGGKKKKKTDRLSEDMREEGDTEGEGEGEGEGEEGKDKSKKPGSKKKPPSKPTSKEESKEASPTGSKPPSGGTSKPGSKPSSKEGSKATSKASSKEPSKQASKEASKASSKVPSKESSKTSSKGPSKASSKQQIEGEEGAEEAESGSKTEETIVEEQVQEEDDSEFISEDEGEEEGEEEEEEDEDEGEEEEDIEEGRQEVEIEEEKEREEKEDEGVFAESGEEEKPEEEPLDKTKRIIPVVPPPALRGDRSLVYQITKGDGSFFNVHQLSSGTVAEKTAAARNREKPVRVSPKEETAPTESPLNLVTMKEWADWASKATDVAKEWSDWIDRTVLAAEGKAKMRKPGDSSQMKKLTREDWISWQVNAKFEDDELVKKKMELKRYADLWKIKIDKAAITLQPETETKVTDLDGPFEDEAPEESLKPQSDIDGGKDEEEGAEEEAMGEETEGETENGNEEP